MTSETCSTECCSMSYVHRMLANFTLSLQLYLSPLIRKRSTLLLWSQLDAKLLGQTFPTFCWLLCMHSVHKLGYSEGSYIYTMHKTPLQYFICFKDHLLYGEKKHFLAIGKYGEGDSFTQPLTAGFSILWYSCSGIAGMMQLLGLEILGEMGNLHSLCPSILQ